MFDYVLNKINWNFVYLDNKVIDYISAILSFLILFLMLYLVKLLILTFFSKIVKNTKNTVDDFLIKLIGSIHILFLFFVSIYIAFFTIVVSDIVSCFIAGFAIIVFTWQFLRVFHISIKYITYVKLGNFLNIRKVETASGIFLTLFKFGVWILVSLYILSTNGVNVASIAAGIGISSIVIAFALKGMLEDLFSSFSIYFDRPFSVGDSVKIDNISGTVTRIGLKSTRIKSLNTGEEVILSNTKLANQEIQNFSRIQKRRVSIIFKISRKTLSKDIKRLINIIEDVLSKMDAIDYKRTHLRSIEEDGFKITIVYFVKNSDYNLYLDIHEQILLDLITIFEKEKIELAHPIHIGMIEK